jgi:hypothetical protein
MRHAALLAALLLAGAAAEKVSSQATAPNGTSRWVSDDGSGELSGRQLPPWAAPGNRQRDLPVADVNTLCVGLSARRSSLVELVHPNR